MLLPQATAKVRALSLENHLALATIRAGRGDFDQICCLIRGVYLAYFMRGETAAGDDVHPYRQAEAALDACIKRIEQNQRCLLLDHEQVVADRVLVLHDDQLAAVPQAANGKIGPQNISTESVELAQKIQAYMNPSSGYTVSHNVMQVQIPRPGSAGSVTAGLLPWPPSP
ncbi:hypothetical protein [Burkholderia multivorans]|uniref:hypothetical protein n=1 Tax=Burkholderia multivorans TaxID=87883 RepID=UPI003F5462B0